MLSMRLFRRSLGSALGVCLALASPGCSPAQLWGDIVDPHPNPGHKPGDSPGDVQNPPTPGDDPDSTQPPDEAPVPPPVNDQTVVSPETVAGNRPPSLGEASQKQLEEAQAARIRIPVSDPDNDALRVYASQIPPGAIWHEAARELTWTPDFTQGGKSYDFFVIATDGKQSARRGYRLTVANTIQPPEPSVTARENRAAGELIRLSQQTDSFLDSPGHAGRSFRAIVAVPRGEPRSKPVKVELHAFGGVPSSWVSGDEVVVAPHDPEETYWWGYDNQLPGQATGQNVPPYTARRVLHLLEWTLRNVPVADPNRVYIDGTSMGGAGSLVIGLLWGRHFSWINSRIGQTVPRFQRPSRVEQLRPLWGPQPANVQSQSPWDRQDVTLALRDRREAREVFVTTKHSKDDPLIHFSAATKPSPATQRSFYASLEAEHVSHLSIWDEGGHGSNDPVMGGSWWQNVWNPMRANARTRLQQNLAHVAFSRASHNDDPGTGEGNGRQSWSRDSGYAGQVGSPGDSGWSGSAVGALNRLLRWQSDSIHDHYDQFSVSIFALNGDGDSAPRAGYPTRRDRFPAALPIRVDVTPRRLQYFQLKPGERVRWSYQNQSGEVTADADGCVTVPQLAVSQTPTALTLSRLEGPRMP